MSKLETILDQVADAVHEQAAAKDALEEAESVLAKAKAKVARLQEDYTAELEVLFNEAFERRKPA